MSMTDPQRLLDQIRIASPCSASWDAMAGDDTVRFCGECKLNVYNLSNMTAARAATLVDSAEGRICVRLYKRKDGTVMTRDCPVGARAALGRVAKAAGATLALLLGLFTGVTARDGGPRARPLQGSPRVEPDVRMGDVALQGKPSVKMGRVVAPRGGLVTFTVTGPQGVPLQGAIVTLAEIGSRSAYIAIDNGDGTYGLSSVEPGVYSLTVSRDDFEPSSPRRVRVRKGRAIDIEVALEPAPAVMGEIAPDAKP